MTAAESATGSPTGRVVYACSFPDYDQIFSPVRPSRGCRHVLLSDRRPRFVGGWAWAPLPGPAQGLSQFFANRYCKFFPHRLFPEARTSVYVDGNILLLDDLRPLIDAFEASGADIALFPHPTRRTVRDELEAGIAFGKLAGPAAAAARRRVADYAALLPEDAPFLFANAILFRRHDSAALADCMDIWWEETTRHTVRDQISLPYALRASGVRTMTWDFFYRDDNPYFHQYDHRRNALRDAIVYARNQARRGVRGARLFGAAAEALEGAAALAARLAGVGGGGDPRARR